MMYVTCVMLSLYDDSVRLGGRESAQSKSARKGVRESLIFSCLFDVYTLTIEKLQRKWIHVGVKLSTGQVEILLLTDDMVALTGTESISKQFVTLFLQLLTVFLQLLLQQQCIYLI